LKQLKNPVVLKNVVFPVLKPVAQALCRATTAARLQACVPVLFASFLSSAAAAAPQAAPASPVPAGSIVQVEIGLGVVLALVVAAAWLLKRFSALRGTGSGLIRIVGGAAVGQRERIVLVEVGGTWLLVGVAPGQVRTLHTMPKGESAAAAGVPPAPTEAGFATWLRRMTEKRSHA
jgi:flagellar protein FliO/FliZ